jgi:acetyl-CoA acyltransferase
VLRAAVIVDAVRSPMAKGKTAHNGKPGGALSGVHPVELLAQTFEGLIERNDIDPSEVEDVIIGCVSQAAEQAGPVGRWAWLAARLPEHVPATTIDRRCGSAQQAIDFAAQGIMCGVYDVVIAGGLESMSRVPMFTARMGRDPHGPSVNARYEPGLLPQGISAELIAAKYGLSRDELDVYSARSHHAAYAVDQAGGFDEEIVPIAVTGQDRVATIVEHDETIRPQTTVEGLTELQPVFRTPEMAERFPEITRWQITAGNSSQLADGASALLIMSEERCSQLGLTPRARLVSFAVASDDPILMLTGPIPATEKVLRRSGMKIDDFDHIEVNEAFAPVPLVWRQHFDADLERLNPRGGAIALGHPLGASGGRLMTTMLCGLEETGGRYGLQTMCEAGGMANATIIERL